MAPMRSLQSLLRSPLKTVCWRRLGQSDTHTQLSHIHACVQQHTHSRAPTTESCLSALPVDITFLWSAPCFTLAEALFGLGSTVTWLVQSETNAPEGGSGEGNLELWLKDCNQTWCCSISGLGLLELEQRLLGDTCRIDLMEGGGETRFQALSTYDKYR